MLLCCTALVQYSVMLYAPVQCVVVLYCSGTVLYHVVYALVQCVVLLYCSGTVSSLLPKYSLHLPGNTLIKQAALPAH
jgi:hypothetical protein